jgi:hypothetical protein
VPKNASRPHTPFPILKELFPDGVPVSDPEANELKELLAERQKLNERIDEIDQEVKQLVAKLTQREK